MMASDDELTICFAHAAYRLQEQFLALRTGIGSFEVRDAEALAGRGRQLAGRTGCGLCGVQTIAQALREPRAVSWHDPLPVTSLWRAEGELDAQQRYNRATGAMPAIWQKLS